jgi:hypothetical protein
MVVHQDSLDDTILNQIKSCFQTIIDTGLYLKKTDRAFNKMNGNLFKYELKIKQKNFKTSSKVLTYVSFET